MLYYRNNNQMKNHNNHDDDAVWVVVAFAFACVLGTVIWYLCTH